MPLPKIATPTYSMVLPSLEKEINYRPFLVKEEKLLVLALESEEYIEDLDYKQMKKVLDIKLPAHYRADYLKIINDVYVPKKKKEEVLFIIQTILEEHGYEEG